MLDYVIVAHDPDRVAIGDHHAESRQDAIDFAAHFLDAEERNGVSVTITVIDTTIDYDLRRIPTTMRVLEQTTDKNWAANIR